MGKDKYKMITLAREIRGLTQTQLAKELPNTSQGNLSRMERGELNIPDETLKNISKILDFPINFFFKKKVNTPISEFYYRKRKSIPKKKLSIMEAEFDLLRMCYDTLLESVDIPEYEIPIVDLNHGGSPEDTARKIREFMNIPKGPVHNLIRLLELNGIIVHFIDASTDKFSGITLITDKGQPIVFINRLHDNARKRFTLAHELGHLVLHIRNQFIDPKRNIEDEADKFSSEFLMPELDCRNDLTRLKSKDLAILKRYWGVSMKALIYRAKDLHLINQNKAQNLYIELSRNGFVKNEPFDINLQKPELTNLIINTFKTELEYTVREIANMLCITLSDYHKFFSANNQRLEVAYKNKL